LKIIGIERHPPTTVKSMNVNILRLFRNLWRQSPRQAVRVLARHLLIRLRGDRFVEVPTPPELCHRTSPTGDIITAEKSWRGCGGTGPMITKYSRTRPSL
jgi:hypothetical protein